MKIKAINYWKENLELVRPYTIAFKTISAVENCFVEITLENGIIGIGSGNPSQQVTGESITQTCDTLNNVDWIIGKDIREINQLCETINTLYGKTPAARAALDIALHDAFSQYLKIPLVAYLGQKIKDLPTSITIGIKSVNESLLEAKEYVERGFSFLKVKLGKSLEEDVEVLTKLRETYGNKIHIRIDANQGYEVDTLMSFYQKTYSLDLELIEQPLPADFISEMKILPVEIKNYIAADESLISPNDAFCLASGNKACGIFNIKLMKCGGIMPAKKIATIATCANVDLMWGCNDESIVSITAALHTAFSCANTKYIDLDGSLDLAKDIVSGGFILQNGRMSIADLPGLGVQRHPK